MVGLGRAHMARLRQGRRQHAAMGQSCALRPPGGARGVDHHGQVLRHDLRLGGVQHGRSRLGCQQRGKPQGSGVRVGRCIDQHHMLQARHARSQPGQHGGKIKALALRHREDRLDRAVVDHMLDLVVAVAHAQAHHRHPDAGRGKEQLQPLDLVQADHADALATLDAHAEQPAGKPRGGGLHLGKAVGLLLAEVGSALAPSLASLAKGGTNGGGRRVGNHADSPGVGCRKLDAAKTRGRSERQA